MIRITANYQKQCKPEGSRGTSLKSWKKEKKKPVNLNLKTLSCEKYPSNIKVKYRHFQINRSWENLSPEDLYHNTFKR